MKVTVKAEVHADENGNSSRIRKRNLTEINDDEDSDDRSCSPSEISINLSDVECNCFDWENPVLIHVSSKNLEELPSNCEISKKFCFNCLHSTESCDSYTKPTSYGSIMTVTKASKKKYPAIQQLWRRVISIIEDLRRPN
ncbi:uncharacterized protein LOC111635612 [Centruroides sculpturatus]|uniref:uncharacterized protein LOC111635612 n=1 Tax=Centruroides sculpturatus TaxID=218467 RepID=UPI000C6CDD04|nr:uncharacterized protein LOC111635612 [Centruroides sculpturatus]